MAKLADNEFKGMIENNHTEWVQFLRETDDADFCKLVVYGNSKGERFQNTLTDILAHLMNHGTHHRAQIGLQLKFGGLEKLPATDYIFYLRSKNYNYYRCSRLMY